LTSVYAHALNTAMARDDNKPGFLRDFLLYHLPFILFGSAILAVSQIPNLKAPNLHLLPFEKVAHFAEYAVFAFLTFRSFSRLGGSRRLTLAMLSSVLFVVIFAALDEASQKHVPGRAADLMDFSTDITGAILVILFFWLRRWRLGKGQN
jgi:VanZ family protein